MTIDTIESVRTLEKVGFKREQAEAQVKAMRQYTNNLATKVDLKSLATEMRAEFKVLRADMNAGFSKHDAEFKVLRVDMDAGFKEIRSEMNAGFKEVHHEMKAFLTTKVFILILGCFTTFVTLVLSAIQLREEIFNLFR